MATILLAEDNEAVRLLTQAKLRHQFTVVTAANGREALDILNRQHVDLIVADVMMPVMDGYQLVRTLRRRATRSPYCSSPLCNPWTASGRAFLPALTIISPSLWITRS